MEKQTVNATTSKLGSCTVVLVLFALMTAGPAAAQGLPDVDEDALEEEEAEERDALPDVDEDDPMYWAQMREVYAMQHRAFLKENRFAATLYGGVIPNNIFEQYFPVGLRLNYYLLENIGLEVSSSYNLNRTTHVNEVVVDDEGIDAQNYPLIGDTQLSHTTAGVKWSPMYGKFTFYDDRLFYFDMYVFGGAGMVVSQTQTDHGDDPQTAVKPEGVFGAGVAMYGGEHIGLRIDYRQFVFQKVDPPGGVANPSEASVGLTWFF